MSSLPGAHSQKTIRTPQLAELRLCTAPGFLTTSEDSKRVLLVSSPECSGCMGLWRVSHLFSGISSKFGSDEESYIVSSFSDVLESKALHYDSVNGLRFFQNKTF